MDNLRRICSAKARLLVTIGVDPERDRSEWERLGLRPISVDYFGSVLAAKYEAAGSKVGEAKEQSSSTLSEFQTSWARRLQRSSSRSFIRIVALREK